MTRMNVYAGLRLDRAAHRRGDGAWLKTCLLGAGARIVPVWRGLNLIAGLPDGPRAGYASPAQLAARLAAAEDFVFLGLEAETAYFAHDLSDLGDAALMPLLNAAGAMEMVDLRAVGGLLPAPEAGLLAYARGMVHWHRRHRFCGVCGAGTRACEAGHQRVCSNPACAALHFPRTDPAVIMLVSDGERVLLGRNRGWAEGLYSTLAGFVEPGESLEDAVRREVLEESGVRVGAVRYHSSQPWPFPASLMLGFFAEACSHAIVANDAELEDVRWVGRAELEAAGEWLTRRDLAEAGDGTFRLPRADSLSRRLIDDWLNLRGAWLS